MSYVGLPFFFLSFKKLEKRKRKKEDGSFGKNGGGPVWVAEPHPCGS
jgi:hypothetical protein